MAWKLIDPNGNEFTGDITKLTLSELRSLGPGWFPWKTYMQRKDRSHVSVFKLKRVGYTDILGIVSVFYTDGVIIDSLEIAPHSRRLPIPQRRYVNLCDIMIAFAALYGSENFGDSFIGLEPKTGLRRHYIRKYKAQPMGVLYGIDPIVTSKLVRLYYI